MVSSLILKKIIFRRLLLILLLLFSQAEPKELMQNRYQHFQRRLARHLANEIQQPQEPIVNSTLRQPLKGRDENRPQQQMIQC